MYKVTTLLFLSIVAIIHSSNASPTYEVFSYSIEEVNTQLAPLNTLEQLHKTYPEKTFQELVLDEELDNYSFSELSYLQNGFNDPMPILPAFWWGCFLGWIGILVVFLVTQDSNQTQSALWGCIVNGLFGCVFYTVIVLYTSIGTGLFWFW